MIIHHPDYLKQVSELTHTLAVKSTQLELQAKEIERLQSLVNDFEAANIRRQGEIESLIAQAKSRVDNLEQLKKDNQRLTRQLNELQKEKTKKDSVTDYSLVPCKLLESLGEAYLTYDRTGHDDDGEEVDRIAEQCRKAATFTPHPQQPTYIDEQGVRRFRKNTIVERLVKECKSSVIPGLDDLNYIATFDATREDHAQLAQLIGYSVDGYQGLSYALPTEDE
jgi:ABC-type transporter Mla subunit MlaD